MSNIVALHEEVNRKIERLGAVVEASVEERPSSGEYRLPVRVRGLPPATYGTVAACDESLAAVRARITDLERLSTEDGSTTAARAVALDACYRLVDEIHAQRSRLSAVEGP